MPSFSLNITQLREQDNESEVESQVQEEALEFVNSVINSSPFFKITRGAEKWRKSKESSTRWEKGYNNRGWSKQSRWCNGKTKRKGWN